MDTRNILLAAKETIKEAINLDNEGKHMEAYVKYQSALDKFILLLRYEKNDAVKRQLMKYVEEYMTRAETLKEKVKVVQAKPLSETNEKKETNSKFVDALSDSIVTEKPNVKWSDIAGLEQAKMALKETIILPLRQPQLFLDGEPWKGILLYGPPGTGKSFLAKACATEADSTFFSISSANLVSKWQGETERLIKALFELARKKRPSIIFIDEIDSMCGAREEGQSDSSGRMKTQFLVQMDGVGTETGQVLVLAATNLPWSLDIAMRRRFEKRIYVPLPDEPTRAKLFDLKLKKIKHDITEKQFLSLAKKSKYFSGADIGIVSREATFWPIRELANAKFFKKDDQGMYSACLKYPPCPSCPMKLEVQPKPLSEGEEKKETVCGVCGALRMTLYEVPEKRAKKREMTFMDVQNALGKNKAAVSSKELKQYEDWTVKFGMDGN